MKERYYAVSRKLIELRRVSGEDISQNPAIKYPYDAEQDRERKAQFEHFYKRTPEQVKDEEQLMLEFARLDKASKKHAQDSQRLLKIVTKRRNKELQLQAAVEKAGSVVGAFARPGKLYTQSVLPPHKQQKYQPHVHAMLVELGIESKGPSSGLTALSMAELRNDIVLFFEMQRLNAEMEYQLMMLQEQSNLLPSIDENAVPAQPNGAVAPLVSSAVTTADQSAALGASGGFVEGPVIGLTSSTQSSIRHAAAKMDGASSDEDRMDDQMAAGIKEEDFDEIASRRLAEDAVAAAENEDADLMDAAAMDGSESDENDAMEVDL